jgi:hypothetical protein
MTPELAAALLFHSALLAIENWIPHLAYTSRSTNDERRPQGAC